MFVPSHVIENDGDLVAAKRLMILQQFSDLQNKTVIEIGISPVFFFYNLTSV